jgi:alcohol dehydrogenase
MKQKEYFGTKCISNFSNILEIEKPKKIFLVTGKKSYKTSGAKKSLESQLKGKDFTIFNEFSSNPKKEEIQEGYDLFRGDDYELLVAVGGGSAIDVAKKIKLDYHIETKIKIPMIAIPTTAGSGSEATHFIVYYIGKEKQSEGNPVITLPEYSILDPCLTMSMSKKIAATTGLDALAQTIESYWSINSTPLSKNFSKRAFPLLIENLKSSINSPSIETRTKVMEAANLTGKAINISKTTACHAISYPLTSFFKIPHGYAAALTLGEMLIYNSQTLKKDCLDKRGQKYVQKTIQEISELLGAENPIEANKKISFLINSIGGTTNLSKLGLNKKDIEVIIKKGFNKDRVKNNPRLITKEILRKILKNIF